MASVNVYPLPGFSPPTQGDSAVASDVDSQAKACSGGGRLSRFFSRTKSHISTGSSNLGPQAGYSKLEHSSAAMSGGSFQPVKTPNLLWPQTPTPMAGAYPNFEWSSGSSVRQSTAVFPPASIAAPPTMMPIPSPAAQVVWVQMPNQSMMMNVPTGVMTVSQPTAFVNGQSIATVDGNHGGNPSSLPTLMTQAAASGCPSVGSSLHGTGKCQPCAWFWKAGRGCQDGASCDHCHLCPKDELKHRKKAKVAAMRMGLL